LSFDRVLLVRKLPGRLHFSRLWPELHLVTERAKYRFRHERSQNSNPGLSIIFLFDSYVKLRAMRLDLSLPIIVFAVTTIAIAAYPLCESRMKALYKHERFRTRDIVLLIVAFSVVIAITALAPQLALLVFFLAMYSIGLFLFAYTIWPKWYFAVLFPAIFIVLYFYHWTIIELDIFSLTFVVFLAMALNGFFSWKTSALFAGLLTVVDVVHVFGTKMMISSALKIVALKLPLTIVLPTFPSEGQVIIGLGDIFLAILLSLQTFQKLGRNLSLICALSISLMFLVLEGVQLNFKLHFFPATIAVVVGWLATVCLSKALSIRR